MTQFILTRHGETEWHAENRYAGSSDIELTPTGVEQSRRLAEWAGKAGLSGLWTSTLSRAIATADATATATGLQIQVDRDLRELDFGRGEGLTMAQMQERFPDAVRAFRADPAANHLPDGEDPVLGAARFIAVLRGISERDPDGRVLVVAHTTVMRLALCSLIGVPLSEYRRLFPSMRNCGITRIRLDAAQVSLLEFNSPLTAEG